MTDHRRPPIRSITVFGAGMVGLSAALAFRQALPDAAITLVVTSADGAALADRLPAVLPGANALSLMAIDEDALMASGVATHRMAQSFEDWREDGATWLHGHGETGEPIAGAAFHQAWRAFDRGTAPFDHYNTASALARQGRFLFAADEAEGSSGFDHALRFDPDVAQPLFLRIARQRRIDVIEGTIGVVRRDDEGGIEAIDLDGDVALTGDFFVDCSGPDAPLLADRTRDDWGATLGTDRLLLASERGTAPSPLDRYRAIDIGWQAQWPLRGRTLRGLAYHHVDEDHALAPFGSAEEEAETIAFAAGALVSPWQGNVLALGDAAAAAGPLGWAGLALAHAHLALALELLPGRDFHRLELAEYNRRAGLRSARVRDFVAAHVAASTRRAGRFWASTSSPVPESLRWTLDRFARRGILPGFEEETYDREDWLAVLMGLGVAIAGPDPTLGEDVAAPAAALDRLRAELARRVSRAPLYRDTLDRMTRA